MYIIPLHTFSEAISSHQEGIVDQIGRQMHKHVFNYNRMVHVTQNSVEHLLGVTSSGLGLLEYVCGRLVCIKKQGLNAI